MKKFLALIFSSALILGACGNDDTSNNNSDTKSENKTEKKSEDKKDNKSKEDKKSKEEKKSQENKDNKSTQEDNSTEEQHTQETTTNEQVQSQQQTQETTTQEQQQTQQSDNNQQQYSDEYLANNPVSTDGDWTPEMIEENERLNEEMEANAKVAKENGYTGIPNGDVGGAPTPDEYYSNDQLDPDTGLPMEDAVPHDVE